MEAEEEEEERTDLKRGVVGPLLCSNAGKVPLYPGDVSVPLQVWGRGGGGRQRSVLLQTPGLIFAFTVLSNGQKHTLAERREKNNKKKKLKVVMVATPVTGNLSPSSDFSLPLFSC